MQVKTKWLNFIRQIFKLPKFEKFLLRYSIDACPGDLIFRLVPNHYQYKKGSIRIVNRNGLNFHLDISDMVDWYIYFGFKDLGQDLLLNICKEDFWVLDIGSNNGSTLLKLSKKAKNGMIMGFEPHPINYERCLKNISLNDHSNIQVYQLGVGNKNEKQSMVVLNDKNYGMNRFQKENSQENNRIEIITLDSFVASQKLTKLDLIKIDVEGFEMKVLKGARNTILKFNPLIFCEVDDQYLKEQNSSAKELCSFLLDINYSISDCSSNDFSIEHLDNCHIDIIATPKNLTI